MVKRHSYNDFCAGDVHVRTSTTFPIVFQQIAPPTLSSTDQETESKEAGRARQCHLPYMSRNMCTISVVSPGEMWFSVYVWWDEHFVTGPVLMCLLG